VNSSERVLVNDRCLVHGRTGITVYVRKVLEHWPPEHPLQPAGFCTRFLRPLVERRTSTRRASPPIVLRRLSDVAPPPFAASTAPSRMKRAALAAYAMAFKAGHRLQDYAAYFEPNNLAIACGGPTVTTCHDLSALEHPEWLPPTRRAMWQAKLEESLAVTGHWIAISNFTLKRMVSVLAIPAEKITVVPLAARELPSVTAAELAEVRKELDLPPKFVLHLGDIQPRKNIKVLLDAYAELPANLRSACPLVLAGPAAWGEPWFWKTLATHRVAGEVRLTGFLPERTTAALVRGATALVQPSSYEGFGLPVLEAMQCGTPVICSFIDAFREVAGDAAEMVDPQDVDGWRTAIERAIVDDAWAGPLREAGPRRASLFSWQRTARQHVEVIASLVGHADGKPSVDAPHAGPPRPATAATRAAATHKSNGRSSRPQ